MADRRRDRRHLRLFRRQGRSGADAGDRDVPDGPRLHPGDPAGRDLQPVAAHHHPHHRRGELAAAGAADARRIPEAARPRVRRGRAVPGREHGPHRARPHPAERDLADPCRRFADGRDRDPAGERAVLHGARRSQSDVLGFHDRRRAHRDPAGLVDERVSRPCDPDHRARHQSVRRRPVRRPQPAHLEAAGMTRTHATRPSVLSVENLSIALPEGGDRPFAVEDVSFAIARNEVVCLVGESGSGKSMIAHAILSLLPKGVDIVSGAVKVAGQDTAALDRRALRRLRGGEAAMIFQEPLSSLNPLKRVGEQIEETILTHQRPAPSSAEIKARVQELLTQVGLPNPALLANSYPFELSGGQRQRVMIAMAMSNQPALLIADEPTTALDVTTQRQILRLIDDLRRERGMGVLLITHDFGVVADVADRVVVLRHGKVVEHGTVEEVLRHPREAYTRELIDAVPKARVKHRETAVARRAAARRREPAQDFSRQARLVPAAPRSGRGRRHLADAA